MNGMVRCPSCGRDNEGQMVEQYRMCSHCGAAIDPAMAAVATATMAPAMAPPPVSQPSGPAPGAPPAYGAPPPGQQPYYGAPPAGAPPYGAQPYPPGYAPMYPAPYPPQLWPPTFHAGVYERPEEPARFDLANMFRMLFKPKQAFEDMWSHTSAVHGAILAIVLIVLSALMSYMVTSSILEDIAVTEEAESLVSSSYTVRTTVIGVVTGILTYFLMAYFTFMLLKSVGKARRPDLPRTIGFFGYARLPGFLIAIPTSILTALMLSLVDWEEVTAGGDPLSWVGQICGLGIIVAVLSIVSLIWSLWIYGHAASVANDVSLGSGVGFTILGYIIAGLIASAVSLALSFPTMMGT